MALQWLLRSWLQKKATDKLREAAMDAVRKSQSSGGAPDDPANPDRPSEEAELQEESPPQPCHVAVLFSLGQEAGGMIDRLQSEVATHAEGFVVHEGGIQGRRVVVATSGVGRDHAERVTEQLIGGHHPDWIISAGFAGGLSETLSKSDILMADKLIDQQNERLAIDLKMDSQTLARQPKLHVGTLLSVDEVVVSPEAKRKLATRFGALAVDTETMAVASVCRREKVRFLSVRMISNGVDDRVPAEVNHLLKQKTTVGKIGAATGALFRRPTSIKQLWQIKEDALTLSDDLAKFLEGVIVQLVSNDRMGSR